MDSIPNRPRLLHKQKIPASQRRVNMVEARQVVPRLLGLLEGHNSPNRNPPAVRLPAGGRSVALTIPTGDPPRNVQTRGEVTSFSPKSRRRLMQSFSELDWRFIPVLPLFITLTYPASGDPGPERWHRDLDVFGKRLRERYPQSWWYWRMEFTEVGTCHFHLMLFNVRFIPIPWLSATWYRIADTGIEAHERAGTQVKRCNDPEHAAKYVTKYCAKVDDNQDGLDGMGRSWGIGGRDYRQSSVEVMTLTTEEAYRLRRILYRLAQQRGWATCDHNHRHGMLLFVGAETTERIRDYLTGEYYPDGFAVWDAGARRLSRLDRESYT